MDNPTDHLTTVRAAPVTNQTDHLTAVRAALDLAVLRCLFPRDPLRNAAPAIAALADECAELRRDKADLSKMFDENPSASWSQLRDARTRIATLEAELAQARAHQCGGIVLGAEDADRIAALLEDPPAPTPAMVALFAKAKE